MKPATTTPDTFTPSIGVMRVTLERTRHTRTALRFGAPLRIVRLVETRRLAMFATGATCARVRWIANAYGTVLWQLMVLQAGTSFAGLQRIAGVAPGARLLLHAQGRPAVRTALARIAAIEAMGLAPTSASPDYWRIVHHRLAARQTPPAYTAERHTAYLARRALREDSS
jgi:hypothetical protein